MLTGPPLLGKAKTIVLPESPKAILDDGDEARLIVLNEALADSKVKGKGTYRGLIILLKGLGQRPRWYLMLAFWLSWYILPSGPKDGIHPYVFHWLSSWPKARGLLWRQSC